MITTHQQNFMAVVLLCALLSLALRAEETNQWTFDVSLYGLLGGMSGNAGIGPVNADVDVGFDKIWDHLKFGAMGSARVGYRWLSIDYETGSGLNRFKYDMIMQSPQVGFTLHF